MLGIPLGHVLVPHFLGPPRNGIRIRVGTGVLWSKRHGRFPYDQRSLVAVKREELALIVGEVAPQRHAKIRIVVQGFDQVGKVASLLVVKQAAGSLGTLGNGGVARNEMNSRNQVNEKIASQPGAVIGKTAPAEEPDRVKWPFR